MVAGRRRVWSAETSFVDIFTTMVDSDIQLITLIGPTASGKTALALDLARKFGGEIVCADSRTIYRGMNIGTAKPTEEERRQVKHHLLDLCDPDETFSAQQFKQAAEVAIQETRGRGKIPFLVGGTGLYVYSVVYDFQFPAGERTAERVELEARPLSELVERLWREDPERAAEIDLQNPRRVIRALETIGQPGQRAMQLPENICLLGLWPPEEVLNKKIVQRTEAMLQMGLVAEVRGIIDKYGPDLEVLRSPGYAEVCAYVRGEIDLAEVGDLINLRTRQLVKRQLTWFKRNQDITWLDDGASAEPLVRQFLESV